MPLDIRTATLALTTTKAVLLTAAAGQQHAVTDLVVANTGTVDSSALLFYYSATLGTEIPLPSPVTPLFAKIGSYRHPGLIFMRPGDQIRAQSGGGTVSASAVYSVTPLPAQITEGFRNRRTWTSTGNYLANDVVAYAGYGWVASQAGSGNQPDTSPTYWTRLGLQGNAGVAGGTGPTGPDNTGPGPAGPAGGTGSVGPTGATNTASSVPGTGVRDINSSSSSSDKTVGATDKGRLLRLAGTFALTTGDAAALGAGFYFYVSKKDGSGKVTFTPATNIATGLSVGVDGLNSISIYQETFILWTDGTTWYSQERQKGWIPIDTVSLSGQTLANMSITNGFLDPEIREIELAYSNLIPSTSASVGLGFLKNGTTLASPTLTIEATNTAGTAAATYTSATGSATQGAGLVSTATAAAQMGLINARNTLSSVPNEQRFDWDGKQAGATRHGTLFDTSVAAQVSGIYLYTSTGTIASINYASKGYRQ